MNGQNNCLQISENCNVGPVANSDYSNAKEENHATAFDITCNTGYSTGTSMATSVTCDDGAVLPGLPTCFGKK